MSEPEYLMLQQQIVMLAGMVRDMDLTGFLRAIDTAEAVGPLFDPTLYIAAHEKLRVVRTLAEGLMLFQKSIGRAGERIKEMKCV